MLLSNYVIVIVTLILMVNSINNYNCNHNDDDISGNACENYELCKRTCGINISILVFDEG